MSELSFRVPPRHLYVHVPFCARRCSYCDFSIAVRREVPVSDYIEGIRRELELRGRADESLDASAEHWPLDTLYLGGGTPSRLGGAGIAELLATIRSHASWDDGAEVTLEANPDDVSLESAAVWRAAGINRVSLGAQSFSPPALEWMRRTHDVDQIGEAVNHLRAAGINQFSIDLIFALPDDIPRDWSDDLARALALRPDHLSLYGLTVEPHTPLGHWRERGEITESPEARYERDFLLADATLTAADFEHYEVSNYALPGARARHNSSYWLHVPYAAIGPSAHRFDGARRSWNVAPYAEWLRRLREGIDPTDGSEMLTPEEIGAEATYVGLRTTDGLVLSDELLAHTARWLDAGWASIVGDRIKLTPLGWLRLDALAVDLTHAGSR
ncbi:MAG: radical SAM family heme chaperone HemW [Gemmatimonadaceae bacterium]|nr:radical SAM family heme chaperone HemW [Gemmatimonadaceae bacterium]